MKQVWLCDFVFLVFGMNVWGIRKTLVLYYCILGEGVVCVVYGRGTLAGLFGRLIIMRLGGSAWSSSG